MRLNRLGLLAALVLCPSLAAAQTLRPCEGFEVNARNVILPPEVGIRTFANGAIRVIGLDTIEPACCWAHLMVIYPLPDEPFPACVLVSDTGGGGFSGLEMTALSASYDPAQGLTVTVPTGRYDPATGGSDMAPLSVLVNQAAGTVQVNWR